MDKFSCTTATTDPAETGIFFMDVTQGIVQARRDEPELVGTVCVAQPLTMPELVTTVELGLVGSAVVGLAVAGAALRSLRNR